MDEDERKRLEAQVRELEEYLEELLSGGASVGGTTTDGQRRNTTEEEMVKTQQEIDALKKLLG